MSATIGHTQRVHPAIPVAAYPELIYGWSPFFGIASRQASWLRFPIPVRSLAGARRPDPVLATDYSLCRPCLDRGPIDLAYDLWISPSRSPVWCGHGATPPPGCIPTPPETIEVMIWLAHSALFHPAGGPAPTLFSPYGWLGGERRRLRFRPYLCRRCTHAIASFVLVDAGAGRLARGLSQARLALRLDDFVGQAMLRLHRHGGYLDGVELGSEIAPLADGDPTRFWFTLRGYCLASAPAACP